MGDSISDISEKLLQRGGGKISVTYDFSERRMCSGPHMLAEAGC